MEVICFFGSKLGSLKVILSLKELEELLPFQLENKPMVITEQQEAEFQGATERCV